MKDIDEKGTALDTTPLIEWNRPEQIDPEDTEGNRDIYPEIIVQEQEDDFVVIESLALNTVVGEVLTLEQLTQLDEMGYEIGIEQPDEESLEEANYHVHAEVSPKGVPLSHNHRIPVKATSERGAKAAAQAHAKERGWKIHNIDKVTLAESNHLSDEAHELVLHGDNTEHLYKNSFTPVAKNHEKKFKKGTYDHKLAVKGWSHHADRVAQDYAKAHGDKGTPWHKMFSTGHRQQASQHWADMHKIEMEAGNLHESTHPVVFRNHEAQSTHHGMPGYLRGVPGHFFNNENHAKAYKSRFPEIKMAGDVTQRFAYSKNHKKEAAQMNEQFGELEDLNTMKAFTEIIAPQIDELSKPMIRRYISKAAGEADDIEAGAPTKRKNPGKTLMNRDVGLLRAYNKLGKLTVEDEQIDELTTNLLNRYTKRAMHGPESEGAYRSKARKLNNQADDENNDVVSRDIADARGQDAARKSKNRTQGVDRALARKYPTVAKESVEDLDESWGIKVQKFSDFKRHAEDHASTTTSHGKVDFRTKQVDAGGKKWNQTSAIVAGRFHDAPGSVVSVGHFNHKGKGASEEGHGQTLGYHHRDDED